MGVSTQSTWGLETKPNDALVTYTEEKRRELEDLIQRCNSMI